MGYEEMLDTVYDRLIDKPEVDMCGAESRKVFQELEGVLDQDTYINMEDFISAGFAENARNGFHYGFRCATALLMGIGGKAMTEIFEKP